MITLELFNQFNAVVKIVCLKLLGRIYDLIITAWINGVYCNDTE